MILVCYNSKFDEIAIWKDEDGWPDAGWLCWRELHTVIEQGWEVIGTL